MKSNLKNITNTTKNVCNFLKLNKNYVANNKNILPINVTLSIVFKFLKYNIEKIYQKCY